MPTALNLSTGCEQAVGEGCAGARQGRAAGKVHRGEGAESAAAKQSRPTTARVLGQLVLRQRRHPGGQVQDRQWSAGKNDSDSLLILAWLDSLLDISWNRIITFRYPRQVPVPVTLLKDFDPMFHREKKAKEAEGEEEKEKV